MTTWISQFKFLQNMEQRKNILIIEVEEANLALAENATFLNLAADAKEALKRYHVITEVMLAQLIGIKDCHVRFIVTPADGVDAVRFWLLPLLRGNVQVLTASTQIYQFFPEQHAPSFTIDFALDDGDLSEFESVAKMNPFCLDCGSRLLNMAFLQCNAERSVRGKGYLSVEPQVEVVYQSELKGRVEFPKLKTVMSEKEWEDALKSPIGGKLQKLYEKQ